LIAELAPWFQRANRIVSPMKNPAPSVEHLDFVAGIPTLNLAHFTDGTPAERAQFVNDLGAAYREVGFVAISGHGVPSSLIDDMYRTAQSFFALPTDVKLSYERPEHSRQRGYVKFGVEHAKDSEAADLKEFWQVGQTDIPEGSDPADYPPNASVAQLPRLEAQSNDLFRSLESVGRQMLRAIALHLGLEETYFESFVPGGNSILRLIHYPPITNEPKSSVRSGQHEDINLITLLVGASAAGLEVMDKEGEWTPVTALPEHLVVNVGDMLQRLTNHHLKSTTHRVVNPPREMWATPRFSMPFFCHPRPSMSLAALPQCVAEGERPQDPPISAGEYLAQRLREIGLTPSK
jgi:isopenicillin N synthase-like dioxygenase